MVRVVKLDEAVDVEHPQWLKEAGIRDFHEKTMKGEGRLRLIYTTIPPGGETGGAVKHDVEEAAFVIRGELTYIVDGKEFTVGPNAAIFIQAGEAHRVMNRGGETAHRLSVGSIK